MDLGILLLRLENAIEGREIYLQMDPGDEDTIIALNLLKDCHAVISRIVEVEE